MFRASVSSRVNELSVGVGSGMMAPGPEQSVGRDRVVFELRPLGRAGGRGGRRAVDGGVRPVRLAALGTGFRAALQELRGPVRALPRLRRARRGGGGGGPPPPEGDKRRGGGGGGRAWGGGGG